MQSGFKGEIYKMKKYLILLLTAVFAVSILFIGISCKEEVLSVKKEVRLTNSSGVNLSPSWSPDGKMIAFTSYRDGNNEIYIMDEDGSGQTRLTNNQANDLYSS